MLKPIILIPAYRPNEKLITLISELSTFSSEYLHIILINDGSEAHYQPFFDEANRHSFVQLLTHRVNLGKGQALKTGLNAVLCQYSKFTCCGVVTCDADGQHLAKDIIALCKKLSSSPEALWIGARQFNLPHIPFRSKLGNILTRTLFKWFVGLDLTDTQSGLRGIPLNFLATLLKTQTSRYDFELDMLILAKKTPLLLKEYPIQTIYEEKNKSSHFNPIIDSIKIYFVFFRYLSIALFSGMMDYGIFTATYFLSQNILLAEFSSRSISAVMNFSLNKKMVFQSGHHLLPEAYRYVFLCLINFFVSYSLLMTLSNNIYFSKVGIMIFLFFANFFIQKIFVFKSLNPA